VLCEGSYVADACMFECATGWSGEVAEEAFCGLFLCFARRAGGAVRAFDEGVTVCTDALSLCCCHVVVSLRRTTKSLITDSFSPRSPKAKRPAGAGLAGLFEMFARIVTKEAYMSFFAPALIHSHKASMPSCGISCGAASLDNGIRRPQIGVIEVILL
jgi:hypothetical protein